MNKYLMLFAFVSCSIANAADVPLPKSRPAEAPLSNNELGLGIICDPLNLLPGCKQQNSPTGPINIQNLWQQIIAASGPDLKYAKALADAANTQGSLIRSACYGALIAANEQSSGALLKNADGTPMVKPDPHLLTDVEQLGQVIDNLSPTGPVFSSCAAAAQAAKMNVLIFIGTIITGASGLAALGVT